MKDVVWVVSMVVGKDGMSVDEMVAEWVVAMVEP